MAACLSEGITVLIRRSNGKIHEAKIISVKESEGLAVVSFVEANATLEKEIVFSDLFSLNPDLLNRNSKKDSIRPRQPSVCKKSPVVCEIEKIEKKREERRANVKALKAANVPSRHKSLIKMINDYRNNSGIKSLNFNDVHESGTFFVCVRKRPISANEISRGYVDVLTIPDKNTVVVHENKQKVDQTEYLENHTFKCDYAFDENTTNDVVYKFSVKPLLKCMCEGGRATCFTYGQTGSGKTYTMEGQSGKVEGIYNYVVRDLFQRINNKYDVFVSFFELYNCKILDLLKKNSQLRLLVDKKVFHVVGLTEIQVRNVDEILRYINKGISSRSAGQTTLNPNSSRSHAILQIVLKKPKSSLVFGKISLIDLAGNERAADMNSNDFNTRREASDINTSLLALKECIRALVRKWPHVPFRTSKLTSILRDCFMGDKTKTCMITTISPTQISTKQTLNSLRYADFINEIDSCTPEATEEMGSDLKYVSFTNSDLPDKWAEHQEVLQQLEACEEVINQQSREWISLMTDSLCQFKKMYEKRSNPYFQVTDGYISCVSKMLEMSQIMNSNFIEKISVFKEKKIEEERLHNIIGKNSVKSVKKK